MSKRVYKTHKIGDYYRSEIIYSTGWFVIYRDVFTVGDEKATRYKLQFTRQ